MKKSTQERCKHCALAVVRQRQKFRPAAAPFPEVRDGKNLISWRRSLPLPTNAVSSYHSTYVRGVFVGVCVCGSVPTNTHTHKYTNPQTGPITIHCAAKLSTQCSFKGRQRRRGTDNEMWLQTLSKRVFMWSKVPHRSAKLFHTCGAAAVNERSPSDVSRVNSR